MSLREHLSFALAFFCVIDDDREREAALAELPA